jgi:hypothetical protein
VSARIFFKSFFGLHFDRMSTTFLMCVCVCVCGGCGGSWMMGAAGCRSCFLCVLFVFYFLLLGKRGLGFQKLMVLGTFFFFFFFFL